ncbi:MAG: HD domain-containing protein [Actinobacteria bacterium]|nr:HD domain-containing protein [Actinomycetota bacterium]
MKNQFIKDLKPQSPVDSVFLISRKNIKKKKNNEQYCILSLMDKSGSIDAIFWTEACIALDLLKKGRFEEGTYVKVTGTVSEYRGIKQLDINSIKDLGKDEGKIISSADFVKTAKRSADDMISELKQMYLGFGNKYLKKLMSLFFDNDAFAEAFCFSPAAVQYHHAYVGGLIEHSLSAAKICDFLSSCYDNIDRELLISGALLHDVGKMEEYYTENNGAIIKMSDKGKLLGHITIGYGMVLDKIESIKDFPPELRDRLLHIILSHHGHKEFGSPKRPKTLEAFIVYHVDHMDADIGGFNAILEDNAYSEDWSEYLKNFERALYIKAPAYLENKSINASGPENGQDGLF